MIKTSFLFQLIISCLSPSHSFLTFPLSSSTFWSQRPWKTNACRSIFVLQWWSVGLIPESNVYTNSTIKNDLGISAFSLHKCMPRKQIASCFDCQQVCCAFWSIDHDLSLLWCACNFVFKHSIFVFILHYDYFAAHQHTSDNGFSVCLAYIDSIWMWIFKYNFMAFVWICAI